MTFNAAGAVLSVLYLLLARPAAAVDLDNGKKLYLNHCAQCHGPAGTPYKPDPAKPGEYIRHPKTEVPLIDEASAPGAPIAHPRPRDLTTGVYKLRSTPSGELPTDEDIIRTISRGMPGTAMPAWSPLLSNEQIADLAAYIKTFSKRFAEEKPSRTLDLRPLPKTADSVKNGEAAYLNLACFMCHGVEGRGDGDVGIYRRDRADQGNKVSAANFHRRWTLRGGPTVDDMYRGFMTGFTLMPAYEESFPATPDGRRQAWDLAYYLDSMSRESPSLSHYVQARAVESLPASLDDAAWSQAPLVDIFLSGQIFKEPRYWEPSITMVSMRALTDGDRAAILLEWDDPRRNLSPVSDAIELQFAVHESAGHFFNGGKPVEEWKWMAGSNKASRKNTLGPAITVKAKALADAQSVSAYVNGRWRVLLTAPLRLDRPRLFSVSAWDGDPEEREEKGLKRSLSGWHYLVSADKVSEVQKLDRMLEEPETVPAAFPWRKGKARSSALKNPYRDSDETTKAAAVSAGKALYARRCLACHGDRLDGEGHFANAFYPRPESFLEEIPEHTEDYIFWRIGRGAKDLPPSEAARSAMPAWEAELTDEQIWQLVTYLYDAVPAKR